MKIGIITWFKYENYGTKLQAIALQQYLRKLNYNVDLINFELNDQANMPIIKKNFLQKIFTFLGRIIYKYERIIYKKQFEKKSTDLETIINKNCNMTKKINNEQEYIDICNDYDCLIFGSDQIWNPNWYHNFYYGNFKDIHTKLIAYAPSFGVNTIPEEKKESITNALKRFSKLAMREQRGCEIVDELLSIKTDIVVDPTLLLTEDEWTKYEDRSCLTKDKYVLCYFLSDNRHHWKAVRQFAKKKKLKLVVIPHDPFSYIASKNVVRSCNVGNFLALIHNAEYVVTDSFHGTVFSIIYKKQFTIFERHHPNNIISQNSRIYNILNIIGKKDILLKYNTKEITKMYILS